MLVLLCHKMVGERYSKGVKSYKGHEKCIFETPFLLEPSEKSLILDRTSLNALQCTTFTLVIRLFIKPELLVSMLALLCMRLNIMFPLVAFL